MAKIVLIALCFLALFALSMAAPQLGFGPFIRPIGLGGFGGRFIGRPFIGTPYYGRGFYPGGFYGGPFRRGFIG